MPQWQGKSKGTALGYRIVIFVCSTFGVLPAYFLLRFVSFYYFLFSIRSSKISYRFFRERIRFSSLRAVIHVYRNYYVFAQTLLDKMIVMANIRNRFTYEFDGEENLTRMVNGGKGGILLSAHVGNWEAAGHLLKRLQTKISVVMYDGEHKAIKNYLDSVTGARNMNIIVIKEDLSHVYAIGDALQKNELVCLLADRFVDRTKTVTRKFMGGEARFPEGPFALAATFKVPVSVVFAFKESTLHYHLYSVPELQREPSEDKHDFMNRLQGIFLRSLEEKLRQYPDQWFNYYNFWE